MTICLSGWGKKRDKDTSTDMLQGTVIPIVESSICLEKIIGTDDEHLMVCAGTGREHATPTGPCKVCLKLTLSIDLINVL